MKSPSEGKPWIKWMLLGLLGALLAPVVGTWVYINLLRDEAPDPLDNTPLVTGEADPSVTLDGTWQTADGSMAGYRVQEVLFGQQAEAVGRTPEVEGTFVIEQGQVTSGSFEADLTAVTSDESRRDDQFHGRIMETDRYPTAEFELTEPLDLSGIEPQQTQGSGSATGNLTVKGVTNPVTFGIEGIRGGAQIQITGSIPIVFADYNIDNPSGGPAQTEDHGLLEFSLLFEKL